jgi:predicted Zn-dependent peptidase
MSSSDYQLYTLNNGLRVAHLKTPSTLLVHCGFVILAGSRNDGDIPGVAHFLEHMFFKGTHRRKTIHVLNHLEVVGGELNAFTTKEITTLYATIQKKHFARAVDILCDITFNSTFPEQEITKEKIVIKDEINMYLDTPEENIYDEFQELIYGNHPLAHNILGTADSVDLITKSSIQNFISENYHPSNMVFVVVGNIPADRVLSTLNKFVPPSPDPRYPTPDTRHPTPDPRHLTPDPRHPSPIYHPFQNRKVSDFSQAYGIMGIPTFEETHAKRFELLLLNNLLGGPGMNSRLNLAIREKYGYTYHIESGYQAFSDSGLFHCYLSCEEKYLNKSIDLIQKELKKLKDQKLGKLQLSQAKNQLTGQLVIANETRSGLLVHLGKGLLKFGKARTMKETIQSIEKITAENLQDTANEVFDIDKFSHLHYIPEK